MAADLQPASQFANLTRRFLEGRQWQRAMDSSLQWLAAAPEDPEAHLAVARCHLNLNRNAEAWRHLHRVLQANPRLAPRESAIIKLQGYCEPENSMARLRLVHRALELNPEDPALHHEIGKFYFHVMRDFARAEDCFRQALTFAPTEKKYRADLFAVVKHRDWIYACLSAPGHWLKILFGWATKLDKVPEFVVILTLPLWLYAGGLFLSVIFIWGATFMPLADAYEWLTLRDIAARAGELGKPRRWYMIRTWPFAVRMSLLMLFFGGLWTLGVYWHAHGEMGALAPAFLLGGVIVYGLIKLVRGGGPRPQSPILPLRARPERIEKLREQAAREQSLKGSLASV